MKVEDIILEIQKQNDNVDNKSIRDIIVFDIEDNLKVTNIEEGTV